MNRSIPSFISASRRPVGHSTPFGGTTARGSCLFFGGIVAREFSSFAVESSLERTSAVAGLILRQSPPPARGDIFFSDGNRAFTLLETLVVVSIVLVLAALAVSATKQALEVAAAAKCQSNLRQTLCAISLYAGENNSELPLHNRGDGTTVTGWWHMTDIAPYIQYDHKGGVNDLAQVYRCPADSLFGLKDTGGAWALEEISFGYNVQMGKGGKSGPYRPIRLGQINNLSQKILIGDSGHKSEDGEVAYTLNPTDGTRQLPIARHNGKFHIGFADGHVSAVTPEYLSTNTNAWYPDK